MERKFASLRQSFPTMMASCDFVDFLQAVHDISSEWAQHLRESRHCSMSLADHRSPPACTSATLLLDGVWPVNVSPPQIQHPQAAEPSDHPATPSLSTPLEAEGLEVAEPADSALLAPFRTSLTAAVCPWPQSALQAAAFPKTSANTAAGAAEPPPLSATARAESAPPQPRASMALDRHAGEAVDTALQWPGPAWTDSGCGCPMDLARLWNDDTEAGEMDGAGGAAEEEAWRDGGRWAGGDGAGSDCWSESTSDSDEGDE